MVPNGLLLGKQPDEYLLHALRSVRPADLEQVGCCAATRSPRRAPCSPRRQAALTARVPLRWGARPQLTAALPVHTHPAPSRLACLQALLLLPFSGVVALLSRLAPLPCGPSSTELVAKVALFTARVHHRQLCACPSLSPVVAQLHAKLEAALRREREVVGYNLAVLRHLRDEAEAQGDGRLFEEAIAARAAAVKAAKLPGAQPGSKGAGKPMAKGSKAKSKMK